MAEDTLAERLRRRPAKPMGSPRVGSGILTGKKKVPGAWTKNATVPAAHTSSKWSQGLGPSVSQNANCVLKTR